MAHLKLEFYNLALLVTSNSGTEVLLPSRKHTSSLCHAGWNAPIPLTGAADVKILRNGVAISGPSMIAGSVARMANLNEIGGGQLSLKAGNALNPLLNARITVGGGVLVALEPKLIADHRDFAEVEWPFFTTAFDAASRSAREGDVHRQMLTNAFEYAVVDSAAATWAVSVNGTDYALTATDGVASLVVWTDEDHPGYHHQFQPECCRPAAATSRALPAGELQAWNGCVQDFGYFYDLFNGTSGAEPVPFKPKNAPHNPGVCIWEPICPFAWFENS